MEIQVNIGHTIGDHKRIGQHAETMVESILGHLAEHITRIEVHVSDENSKKEDGHDKRCMIEARLKGHRPIAVTNVSDTIGQAIGGAVEKVKSSLDHTLGRLGDHEGRKHLHSKSAEEIMESDSPEEDAVIWKSL